MADGGEGQRCARNRHAAHREPVACVDVSDQRFTDRARGDEGEARGHAGDALDARHGAAQHDARTLPQREGTVGAPHPHRVHDGVADQRTLRPRSAWEAQSEEPEKAERAGAQT